MSKLTPFIFAIALLLIGCAMPSPLVPQPPEPGPIAAVSPTSTPAPRGPVTTTETGMVTDAECTTCWSTLEIVGAIFAAGLFLSALIALYRKRK